MSDREYFRFARSWHALLDFEHPANNRADLQYRSVCGRVSRIDAGRVQIADRIPPDGHLCQNCGRSIAAQTDIERVEDVPEPVATEHDDFEGAPV